MPTVWPNRIITFLSMAGFGVSAYLTAAHLNAVKLGCTRLRGCDEVARHWSAKGLGLPGLEFIPTAALGTLMYITLLVLSFMRVTADSDLKSRRFANLQWLIGLSGVLVSGWLTYMEAYVIRAWCQWCLVSAFLILFIFITASLERFRTPTLGRGAVETQGEPV